jgi:hypothetical protein
MQNKGKEADAKMLDAQAKMTTAQAISAEKKAGLAAGAPAEAPEPPPNSVEVASAQAKLIDAHTREMEAKIHASDLELRQHSQAIEDQNRDEDRDAKMLDAKLGLAKDLIGAPPGAQDVAAKTNRVVKKLGEES